MASLLKRTAVLSFSLIANQAIMLLSPLLLVRILSVGEYGSYREFLLYVGLIGPFVTFASPRSLTYMLPKYPDRERTWVTQAALFVFFSSTVALVLIHLLGDLIRSGTSFDFVFELKLYIFFLINLDFLEFYWIAKKRADFVLYYSSGRLLARTSAVVIVALVTKDTRTILHWLIAVEIVRFTLVLLYALYKDWFTAKVTRASAALQSSYFLPMGAGGIVEMLSSNIGLLFVSLVLGVEALAFYAIGMFVRKIVNVLRGAIGDTIFPDIVEVRAAEPREALPLWHRATVWYCLMLFPSMVYLAYYADAVVTILFTAEYSAAIPIFSVFSFLLILDCFDFHMPLRVQNANRYYLIGSIIALVSSAMLLYPAYSLFGFIGPAVAFVVSRLVFTIYLASRTVKVYEFGVVDLARWREIGKVLLASLVCSPILVAGKQASDDFLLRSVIFAILYFAAYMLALRILSVPEAQALWRRLTGLSKGLRLLSR